MKYVGFSLLAIGLALLLFVVWSFMKSGDHIATPVPEDEGVTVIFITPTK